MGAWKFKNQGFNKSACQIWPDGNEKIQGKRFYNFGDPTLSGCKMSAGKKQIQVTADLIGRTLHQLDELGVPYALCIEGIPTVFTNSSKLHSDKIIERQWLLNNKIEEYQVELEADKQTGWRNGDRE